jgi:hypothetical protein
MAVIEIAKIQVRRGQENQTGVPQLEAGEFGWAQDTEHLYIGKRISEGANTDENTRILTENDLLNIFNLVDTTSTQIINYTYREQVPHILNTVPISLQDRLDQRVSLSSFGVVPSFTATDITVPFQNAVNTLFYNSTEDSFQRTESKRKLVIPAGNYLVREEILLPPFAQIEGEGPGITKITLIETGTHLFRTVDAVDPYAALQAMNDGIYRARNVVLSNMTIEYATTANSSYGLLALDNVQNANITNVEFGIQTSTSLVSDGIGIQLRGTKNSGVELCDNIQILNCNFNSLNTAIEGTGTVTRMVIKDNKFTNLQSGIRFFNVDEFDTPSKGIVTNNKFENIIKEALYVGTDTTATHHISQYNIFYQVGNGITLDDNTSTEQYAVINFLSDGNKSIDDYFSRQNEAITNVDPNFYYNPLVVGAVSVINNTVFKYNTIPPGVTDLTKIPLTNSEQRLEIEYKFFDDAHQYNRTGKLLINISKGAEVDIEFTATSALLAGVSTVPLSGIDYDVGIIQVGAEIAGPGIQPLTTVTSVGTSTVDISLPTTAPIAQNDVFTITQFSESYGLVSDYYNFSYEASWPHGDPDEAVFLVSEPVNNYVTLTFTNWTSVVNFNMEYQFSRNT